MKVLAVLVLAVFSGCHADLFSADAPMPEPDMLDLVTDNFWDLLAVSVDKVVKTLQMIRESQPGQNVNAVLTENAEVAREYAVAVLPPVTRDLLIKAIAEVDVLKERVNHELSTFNEKLGPFNENMKAQIRQRVAQLQQELAPFAESMDADTLRTTLMQKTEELKTRLQAQLGPYTDELKLVDQRLQLTQRAQQVKELTAPYIDELRKRLDPYTQDLQAKLTSLYESTKSTSS